MHIDHLNELQRDATWRHGSKRILLIICIYFMLTIASKITHQEQHTGNIIKQKISNGSTSILFTDLKDLFTFNQEYEGVWRKKIANEGQYTKNLQTQASGMFQFIFINLAHPSEIDSEYRISLKLKNGKYIDEGIITFTFQFEKQAFKSIKSQQNSFILYLMDNKNQGSFKKSNILICEDQGSMNIDEFKLIFTHQLPEDIKTNLEVNILDNILFLQITGKKPKLTKIIIFAIIIFFTSYTPFSAIFIILKDIYNGQDNPGNYSLITLCLANMMDAVLCMLTFFFAFSDTYNLILLIMPAFLFGLIFTNLQPRLMLLVYNKIEASFGRPQKLLCKFNIIHYGSWLLIYPLLLLTNLNWILFLILSCMIFPQIYLNGVNGIRPNLSSKYYLRFIMSRFLFLLYLRCYPDNIFELEPNYPLGLLCTFLVCFQLYLLHIQKKYGPKTVIPKCLLTPSYDYRCEEELNIQENTQMGQCSICLTPLHVHSQKTVNQLQFEPDFKVMKTPCNHKYHSICLIVWMKIKHQCPQCRAKIPPYE